MSATTGFTKASPITPHDTNPVNVPHRAILIAGAGNLACRPVGEQTDRTIAVPAGLLYLPMKYIRATSTTATGITGLWTVLLCLLLPAWGGAQTVLNPTTVEFRASADHGATTVSGEPKVARYDFRIYLLGATAPVTSVDLGKPTPDAQQTITAQPDVLLGLPVGQLYEARVAAVGPTGEGVSDVSNPFGREGPPVAPLLVVIR